MYGVQVSKYIYLTSTQILERRLWTRVGRAETNLKTILAVRFGTCMLLHRSNIVSINVIPSGLVQFLPQTSVESKCHIVSFLSRSQKNDTFFQK